MNKEIFEYHESKQKEAEQFVSDSDRLIFWSDEMAWIIAKELNLTLSINLIQSLNKLFVCSEEFIRLKNKILNEKIKGE